MRPRLLQACSFFRIWCVVELVAALQGNVPVILLVGAEDLTVYNATSSLESEGAPIGAFQPNPAMLDTLVEMVDVGKDRLNHSCEQIVAVTFACGNDRVALRLRQVLGPARRVLGAWLAARPTVPIGPNVA